MKGLSIIKVTVSQSQRYKNSEVVSKVSYQKTFLDRRVNLTIIRGDQILIAFIQFEINLQVLFGDYKTL